MNSRGRTDKYMKEDKSKNSDTYKLNQNHIF